MDRQVRVGVAVIIENENHEFLLGQRLGSHGAGQYALPGGHLEFGETPEQAARREVLEETGLQVGTICPEMSFPYANTIFDEEKQYITLFMCAQYLDGEPVLQEPGKCAGWGWYSLSNLPSPLFAGADRLFKFFCAMRKGPYSPRERH